MTPEDLQEIRHLPSFPRIAEELIQVAGLEAAARLISAWPGQEYPCPKVFGRYSAKGQRRYDMLQEIVGDHAARRIVMHWGGGILDVPSCKDALWAKTHDKIRSHYDRLVSSSGGYSHREAVFELGLTYNLASRTIERVISQPSNPDGSPMPPPDDSQMPLF